MYSKTYAQLNHKKPLLLSSHKFHKKVYKSRIARKEAYQYHVAGIRLDKIRKKIIYFVDTALGDIHNFVSLTPTIRCLLVSIILAINYRCCWGVDTGD